MRLLYASSFPIEELRKIGGDINELKDNNGFFLFSLIFYFWNRGDEIVIVSSSRQIKKQEEYKQERMDIVIVPLCRHGRISAFLNFQNDVRLLERVISKKNCDIYHAHWCYEYAQACVNLYPKNTIVTLHDWPDKVCSLVGNFYWKRKNKLGNNVIEHALLFTAVSPYIKEMICSKKKGAVVSVIPNFINVTEKYKKKNCQEEKSGVKVIMVNNGFGEIKNPKKAIRAFELFHKTVPDSVLSMYGDDFGEGEKAQKWTLEEEIDTDGMFFGGRVSRIEINKAFGKADVLLHTSREESFGLIYLEAMNSDTAIIAGKNSGATSWVLKDGKCGCLVDVEDEESIVKGLNEVYVNNNYRQKLIKAGRDRLQDFCADKVFLQYSALYNESYKANHDVV